MASKKAGGTAKNLNDSQPKFLGVKLFAGQRAQPGDIIVRQRGTRMLPGTFVGIGRDHTLYATAAGIISFRDTNKKRFDGRTVARSTVDITADSAN